MRKTYLFKGDGLVGREYKRFPYTWRQWGEPRHKELINRGRHKAFHYNRGTKFKCSNFLGSRKTPDGT